MENFSTKPIKIAMFQTTPLSYLPIPKVSINATDNNCLYTTYWEKVIMTDCAPFVGAIWSCYKRQHNERFSRGLSPPNLSKILRRGAKPPEPPSKTSLVVESVRYLLAQQKARSFVASRLESNLIGWLFNNIANGRGRVQHAHPLFLVSYASWNL